MISREQDYTSKAGWALLVSGGLLTAFFLWVLVSLWEDYRQTPAQPSSMILASAAETIGDDRLYVTIEDGRWQCSSISYTHRYHNGNRTVDGTRAIMRNEAGNVAVVARFSEELTCADLQAAPLTGVLTRMDAAERERYATISGDILLEMCAYCGPANALTGILVSGVFALLGGGLIGLGMFLIRRSKEKIGSTSDLF